jgi:hypothetical protein
MQGVNPAAAEGNPLYVRVCQLCTRSASFYISDKNVIYNKKKYFL